MIAYLSSLLIISVYMTGIWWIYTRNKVPSVVDVAWAGGLVLLAYFYLLQADMSWRIFLISHVVLIWGLRLGGYLWFTRVRTGEIDKRYQHLSDSWKMAKSLGFFLNFQLQGFLISLISLVFLAVQQQAPIPVNLFDILMLLLALVGILGEAVADWQLHQFKAQHPAGVCDRGLWAYSRHPNYCAELLIWFAFAMYTLHSLLFILGLMAPLTLFVIMWFVTGPMTERSSLRSRGELFIAYQAKTPYIFPFIRSRS